MSELPDAAIVSKKKRWRLQFALSVRGMMLLIAVIAVILATQYHRTVITPKTAAKLTTVARLDKDEIYSIVWSPDRGQMAVIAWEKPVEIRDPVGLRLIETIGAGKKIIHFAFSPNKRIVAYTENFKPPVILDRETQKTITPPIKDQQADVVFSPDGKLLATGGYSTQAQLWRVSDGQHMQSFVTGPTQGGLRPEFSPDGRILAVGNRNSTTTLFDVATGELLHTLPKRETQGLQFDPTGKTLAVTYCDGSIGLWNVADGKLILKKKTTAEELYTLDWSPNGEVLVTAGHHGKITLWNPSDLSIIREIDAPDWVIRVKFSPDGLSLHFAAGDGKSGGKRWLEVMGIEGSLFSLLNRPRK
jgi:WD40 repeat protein